MLIYQQKQNELEKFSRNVLHNTKKHIIIPNVKNIQIYLIGGIVLKEKITVLIADDNQDFANILAGYLKKHDDMEIIGMAKDGNEAVEIIRNVEPDVAILDVIMPHLDGLGVLEKINEFNMPKDHFALCYQQLGKTK